MALKTPVDRESGKAENGQRIRRQAPAQILPQLLCNHLPAGDGYKTGDIVALDGDIGRADVVSKLILSGVALKESIEVDIPTAKSRSVVPGLQPTDASLVLAINHGTALSVPP